MLDFFQVPIFFLLIDFIKATAKVVYILFKSTYWALATVLQLSESMLFL